MRGFSFEASPPGSLKVILCLIITFQLYRGLHLPCMDLPKGITSEASNPLFFTRLTPTSLPGESGKIHFY